MSEKRYQIAMVVVMDVGARDTIEAAYHAAIERITPQVVYAEVIEGLSTDYQKEEESKIIS